MGVMLDNLLLMVREGRTMLRRGLAWILAVLGVIAIVVGIFWLRGPAFTLQEHIYSGGLAAAGFGLVWLATKIGLGGTNEPTSGV